MTGISGSMNATDATLAAVQRADRAEGASIRRFRQLAGLADAVAEAARRADATIRLDLALRTERAAHAGTRS